MQNETTENTVTVPGTAPEEIQYPIWETQGGTTPEQNEARFNGN